jgi:hypothetical protein
MLGRCCAQSPTGNPALGAPPALGGLVGLGWTILPGAAERAGALGVRGVLHLLLLAFAIERGERCIDYLVGVGVHVGVEVGLAQLTRLNILRLKLGQRVHPLGKA